MRRPEQALQQAVYKYIRYAAPHVLVFHVPNGMRAGGRNPIATGAIFKSMGVVPGVADLLLFWKEVGIHAGCGAIELKAGKGKLTDHQVSFSVQWTKLGGKYAVCKSIDDVEASLKHWRAI